MKTQLISVTRSLHLPALACALWGLLAPSAMTQTQGVPNPAGIEGYEKLAPEALDELVGPFALYPDALIALILPSSTVPSDITLAARYLNDGGTDFDRQLWDESVQSLARYPEVLTWMDENLAWTAAVGNAFVAQPTDVMNAIQRLRETAADVGNLKDTPEQVVVREVVEERTYIRIIPAEPERIYVPYYDPEVVYVAPRPNFVGNIISFGAGFAIGSWLNYDCNWGRGGVYYGDYRPGWNTGWNNGGRDYRGGYGGGGGNVVNNSNTVNVSNITNVSANQWQPTANSRTQLSRRQNSYNRRVQASNAELRNSGRRGNGSQVRPGRRLQSLPRADKISARERQARSQRIKAARLSTAGNKEKQGQKIAGKNRRSDVKPKLQAPQRLEKRESRVDRSVKRPGPSPIVKGSRKGSLATGKKSPANRPGADSSGQVLKSERKKASVGNTLKSEGKKRSSGVASAKRPSQAPRVSGSRARSQQATPDRRKTPGLASSRSPDRTKASKLRSQRPSEPRVKKPKAPAPRKVTSDKKSSRTQVSRPQNRRVNRPQVTQPKPQKVSKPQRQKISKPRQPQLSQSKANRPSQRSVQPKKSKAPKLQKTENSGPRMRERDQDSDRKKNKKNRNK